MLLMYIGDKLVDQTLLSYRAMQDDYLGKPTCKVQSMQCWKNGMTLYRKKV